MIKEHILIAMIKNRSRK